MPCRQRFAAVLALLAAGPGCLLLAPVPAAAETPSLAVSTFLLPASAVPGKIVQTVVVTNDGEVSALVVHVEGDLDAECRWLVPVLQPGRSTVESCLGSAPPGRRRITATATGRTPNGVALRGSAWVPLLRPPAAAQPAPRPPPVRGTPKPTPQPPPVPITSAGQGSSPAQPTRTPPAPPVPRPVLQPAPVSVALPPPQQPPPQPPPQPVPRPPPPAVAPPFPPPTTPAPPEPPTSAPNPAPPPGTDLRAAPPPARPAPPPRSPEPVSAAPAPAASRIPAAPAPHRAEPEVVAARTARTTGPARGAGPLATPARTAALVAVLGVFVMTVSVGALAAAVRIR